jgi:hypothetical protein
VFDGTARTVQQHRVAGSRVEHGRLIHDPADHPGRTSFGVLQHDGIEDRSAGRQRQRDRRRQRGRRREPGPHGKVRFDLAAARIDVVSVRGQCFGHASRVRLDVAVARSEVGVVGRASDGDPHLPVACKGQDGAAEVVDVLADDVHAPGRAVDPGPRTR